MGLRKILKEKRGRVVKSGRKAPPLYDVLDELLKGYENPERDLKIKEKDNRFQRGAMRFLKLQLLDRPGSFFFRGGKAMGDPKERTLENAISLGTEAMFYGVPGSPKGLPNAFGISPDAAVKMLGRSASSLSGKRELHKVMRSLLEGKITKNKAKGAIKGIKKHSVKIPAKRVRDLASVIRRLPRKELDKITELTYSLGLGEDVLGRNIRIGGLGESKIRLAPEAQPDTLFHEVIHGSSWARSNGGNREKPTLQNLIAQTIENSTALANLAIDEHPKRFVGRRLYWDSPVEIQARRGADILNRTKEEIPQKLYDEIFAKTGRDTIRYTGEKAPTLLKEAFKYAKAKYPAGKKYPIVKYGDK